MITCDRRVIFGVLMVTGIFTSVASGAMLPYSFNVKDFGAVGDGVHDDTLALQRAADSARVNDPQCGQVESMMQLRLSCTEDGPVPEVYFPKGVYRITGPVVFTGNAFVRGEDAEILNTTTNCDTFFFNLGYRVDLVGLRFSGGRIQVRQFTQNRDISSARVSKCTFKNAAGTALCLDSLSDVNERRSAGKAAFFKSAYEVSRRENGRAVLSDVNPELRRKAANSTIILIERCDFWDCVRAVYAHSDGVNIDCCRFIDTRTLTGPIVHVATTVSLTRLCFECRTKAPGRIAVLFSGGAASATDVCVKAPFDMCPFSFDAPSPLLSNVLSYPNVLSFKNVALDAGTGAVLRVCAESLPQMLTFQNVRRERDDGFLPPLVSFEKAPLNEDLLGWARGCRQSRYGVAGLFGWAASGCEGFSDNMPSSLVPLRCKACRLVVKDYPDRKTEDFGNCVVTDTLLGVSDCRNVQDDTDKMAELLARVAGSGGGTILLPPRWITLSRTLDLPTNVRMTSVGRAVIRARDYTTVFFRGKDGGRVRFENILFNRGASVFVTESATGSACFDNCHFYDQDGVTLKTLSSGSSAFRLNVRFGTSFVPHLYDGNAVSAVFDSFWLEYAPAFDKTAWDVVSDKSQSCLVNRQGGVLKCYDVLGVPCIYWHAAPSKKDREKKGGFFAWIGEREKHPELYGDFRWVDNYGDFVSLDFRYGGEWAGLTPVYQFGETARTIVAGHSVSGSLFGWTKARHATVLSDCETANVILAGVDAMNRMDEPLTVLWRDASGILRRAKGWKKENCFPHEKE